MRSKRSLEGELFIDHRASPGLTATDLAGFDAPAVGAGQTYESAIVTCSHCQATVVLNPQRTRDRGWCAKCDKYLCDACEYIKTRTLECRSMERRLEAVQEQVERSGSASPLLFTQ